MRGGRFAHDDDPEYEPWIERVVGTRHGKRPEDSLPTKHSASDEPKRSRSVDDILMEGRNNRFLFLTLHHGDFFEKVILFAAFFREF